MWNKFQTDEYEGMLAETITIPGYQGDRIHAYFSRPLGVGPFPGIVLIPHIPGWDEYSRETARRFSQHGYLVVCPDIYCRIGHGTPDEISKKSRELGGVSDDSVMGDSAGSLEHLQSLPYSNGKVGVIGMCSGGRHAFMAACRVEGFDAVVDCWGGRVVAAPEELKPSQPVQALDYTPQLSCPLLGISGNDDTNPTPEHVNILEEELKKYKKDYQFYRYDGAPHGFWYYHTDRYRPKAAMDSWDKVFEFFDLHLKEPS